MNARELDQAYVLLSQTITRVAPERRELFLARLALLLLASHGDPEAAATAIGQAREISAVAATLAGARLSDGAA